MNGGLDTAASASQNDDRRPPYRLWGGVRGAWFDTELQHPSMIAMRALYPRDWDGRHQQIDLDFEIVPEINGPLGEWSLSARALGMTIGYLHDASEWAEPIRRIVASGFRAVTNGNVWAYESPFNDDPFDGKARINLGSPEGAVPINDPPGRPHTLLPRGSIVQVTKEEDHTDALLKHVPASGTGPLILTLHEQPGRGTAKPHVEVRIDDERVGQLTPQMSQRFLPMIRHLGDRGLLTAARGDITGSKVAAEVRVESIKANEADDQCLNGTPVTVPKLLPRQRDPRRYDLAMVAHLLRPMDPPKEPAPPPELRDGTVVKFSSGRYTYLAIRRGPLWETTASSWAGPFREAMTWAELTKRIRSFEVPTGWERAAGEHDPRVHRNGTVVHFHAHRRAFAALCVSEHYETWYVTMTESAEENLPFDKQTDWDDLARSAQSPSIVTGWTRFP